LFEKLIPIYEKYYSEKDRNVSILSVPPVIDSTYINFEKVTDQSFEKYYNILKGFDKVDTVQDLENNNTIGALNPDGFVGKTLSVADGVNYVWSFFKYNELNIKNIDRLLNVNVRDSRFLNTSYKDMKGFDLSLLNLDNSNHKNDFYENVALTALRFAPLTSQEFLSIFDKLSEGHKKEFIIGRGKELKFNEEQILNVLKKYDLDNIHALGSLDLIFRLSDVHITRKVLDAIKEKITNTVIWSGIIENQSNVDPEIFTNDYYMDQLDWDNFDIAKSMKPEVLTEEFLKKYITRIHTMTLADIFNTRIKASNDFIFGLLENPLKNKFVIPYIVSDINIDLFNLLLKSLSKPRVNMILSESSMSDVVFDKVLETNILSIDDLASNPNLTDSQRYKLISKFNTKNTGPQTFYKLNEVLKDKNNLYVGHTYPLYTNKNVAEIVKYWIENWRKGISLTESASTFSNDFTISDIEVRSGQSRVVFNKNSTYTAYSPEDNYSVSYKKESRYGKSGGVKNLKYATRSTIHTNPNEISTLLDERDKNYKSGRDEWLITMNPAAIEKIEVYDREPTREELILNEEFGIPLEQHSINNNQTQLVKRWEGNSEKQFYYQRSNSGNTRGFYDFANKVAYLVDNVADESTTVHESFTHPFLEAAKIENPELYANLLKEAKKNSDVKAFVDDVYSDRPQAERDIEYITHAVDKYLRGELDAIKDKGLIERIKEFFKNMSDALKKILDIKTTVGEIDPNLTLGDLAQYVLYGEGQIDLTQTENQTETKSNTRKSQLGKRIQKGEGVSEQFAERVTDIDVLKQENDVTVAEADAVIEAFGEEAAQDFVLARDQKNGPSDSIRVTIGQRLVKRWADAADRAKTPEERDFFNSKAIEVLDGLMDLANDVGRALQMFRLWRDMGPEGYILYAKKLGEKIKKQAKKQFEKTLNDIKKVNDKAVDEATRQIGEDIAKEYAIDKIKLIEVIRASLDKNLAAKMKEAFNLTAEESERLANRITKSFDNIYGRMIKETLKRSLPYKLRKYRNLIDNLVKNKKLTDDAIVSAILKELGINPDLTNEQMDYLREALRPMRDIPEDSAQLKDDGAREAIALIHEMFGSEAQSFIPKTNRDSLGWGLFYASILSGPRTQALNIGANIVKMVLDNMWLSIAEWRANKGNPERLRIAISNWLGLWQGIQKGRIEAKEIFFHGRKKTSFSNKFFESSELERWGKEWNIFNNIKNSKNFWEVALKQTAWMAKFVPRFMESADVIAYWGNYMGRYRQLMTEVKANQGYTGRALASEVNKIMYGGDITKQEAIDQATKELTDKDGKFKGKVGGGFYDKIDVRRRADEILEQNLVKQFGQEVLWDADRFAKNATFQQDPKGVMGTVVNTIQKYHSHKNKLVAVPARLIVPFTRIVANVTNDQLEYIPFIGLARGQNILSKNELTLEERRIATAKGLASMIVLGLGVAALSMFDPADEDEWKVKIHGNGPQDFNKIIQLKGENWQPNSLQVGNTYFSFKDMPFGLFLTLMGNLFDSERYSKGDPSMSASAIQSLLSSPQVILDASFLSGASAFFETVINSKDLKEDKMVENWEKFFVNQGKVVIPNLFRQVASSFDPTWYQTKGIKEYFYKQYAVPYIQLAGGEVDLQPYFTNLGDPVKFGRDGTFPTLARLSGISRFINVKKEDEIVYDFLDAKNIYIPGLGYGTTVDGKNLWSEDRETFVKLHRRRGELIKEYVKDNMERFKNMSKKDIEDEIKERVSGNTKESFTTEAKKELGLYSTKGRPKRPTRSTRKRGRD
ncbi:hypothetical protein KC660_04580, partial [Candidatus Dojkabacteria bacterium]|nr:hypothetical protein [Candidatus Dojkabacteria bacterium]